MKFSFIHLIRFRVDKHQGLPTSYHESQYDGCSSCMPTIVSIYSKHAGCVLCFWRKNLWLFVFEMHLIKG